MQALSSQQRTLDISLLLLGSEDEFLICGGDSGFDGVVSLGRGGALIKSGEEGGVGVARMCDVEVLRGREEYVVLVQGDESQAAGYEFWWAVRWVSMEEIGRGKEVTR